MSFIIAEVLAPIIINFTGKNCIVEIGSGGTSTPLLARVGQQTGVKFYSCDIRREVKPLYPLHFPVIMPSFDFIKTFNDTPSIVFIDGNHDHEITMVEMEFFLKKMVVGGVIFMHDTYPPTEKHLSHGACSDSYKTRLHYEKRREIVDVFTWPYTAGNCGLTMYLKKAEGRPFYRE